MASARQRIEEEVTCPVCMEPFSATGEIFCHLIICFDAVCFQYFYSYFLKFMFSRFGITWIPIHRYDY